MLQKQIMPDPSSQTIEPNVPLKDKTWFQTGGPARFFATPTSAQTFKLALEFAHLHNHAIFLIGHGANILVSDNGVDGLVIRPNMKKISHTNLDTHQALVKAEAGTSMHDLIAYCLDQNLLGLEEFSGIPGTVGGSVFINLHYFIIKIVYSFFNIYY